ncbi:MAG: flagellar assembly protein FliX [Alphaproteobacteria bacterium]
MKVEGPGKAQSASSSKKPERKAGTSSFGDFMTDGPVPAAGARATQSIALVDSLLAVQGSEDPGERAARRRTYERGDNILKELDKIRLALLGGDLRAGQMLDIADMVAAHREKIKNPAMSVLMDEIDLRAQVELAKIRYMLEAPSR